MIVAAVAVTPERSGSVDLAGAAERIDEEREGDGEIPADVDPDDLARLTAKANSRAPASRPSATRRRS